MRAGKRWEWPSPFATDFGRLAEPCRAVPRRAAPHDLPKPCRASLLAGL